MPDYLLVGSGVGLLRDLVQLLGERVAEAVSRAVAVLGDQLFFARVTELKKQAPVIAEGLVRDLTLESVASC